MTRILTIIALLFATPALVALVAFVPSNYYLHLLLSPVSLILLMVLLAIYFELKEVWSPEFRASRKRHRDAKAFTKKLDGMPRHVQLAALLLNFGDKMPHLETLLSYFIDQLPLLERTQIDLFCERLEKTGEKDKPVLVGNSHVAYDHAFVLSAFLKISRADTTGLTAPYVKKGLLRLALVQDDRFNGVELPFNWEELEAYVFNGVRPAKLNDEATEAEEAFLAVSLGFIELQGAVDSPSPFWHRLIGRR